MSNEFRTFAAQSINDIKPTLHNLFHRFTQGGKLLGADILSPQATAQQISARFFKNSKHQDLRLSQGFSKLTQAIFKTHNIESKRLGKNEQTTQKHENSKNTELADLNNQVSAKQSLGINLNTPFVQSIDNAVDQHFESLMQDDELKETFENIDAERFNHGAFINTHRQAAVLNLQDDFIRPGALNKETPSAQEVAQHYKTLLHTCIKELELEDERAFSQGEKPRALYFNIKGNLPGTHTDVKTQTEKAKTTTTGFNVSRETKGQIAAKKELCKAAVKAGAVEALLNSNYGNDPTIQHFLSRYTLSIAKFTGKKDVFTGSQYTMSDHSRAHRVRIDLNPIKMPFQLAEALVKEPVRGVRNGIHSALGNPIKLKSTGELIHALIDNREKLDATHRLIDGDKNTNTPSMKDKIEEATQIYNTAKEEYKQQKKSSQENSSIAKENYNQAKNTLQDLKLEYKQLKVKRKNLEKSRLAFQKRLFKLINPSQYDIVRAEHGLVKAHTMTGRGEFSGFIDMQNLRKVAFTTRQNPIFRQKVLDQAINDSKTKIEDELKKLFDTNQFEDNQIEHLLTALYTIDESSLNIDDDKFGLAGSFKPEWAQYSKDPIKGLSREVAKRVQIRMQQEIETLLPHISEDNSKTAFKTLSNNLQTILKGVYKPSAAEQQQKRAEQRKALFQDLAESIESLYDETKATGESKEAQAEALSNHIKNHPNFEAFKTHFDLIARSNQRGELFSMLHDTLHEIENHHSISNMNHQSGDESIATIHDSIQETKELIQKLNLHTRNTPQDIIIQNLFDGRNGDLLRGSQRALQNDIHAMSEALPKVLGIIFAHRNELNKSTFMIDENQLQPFSNNLKAVLEDHLFFDAHSDESLSENNSHQITVSEPELLKARLNQVYKNALIQQPSLRTEDLLNTIAAIKDVPHANINKVIGSLTYISTYQNLNKFAATSISKNQLDQFYFDGIDNPLKQSSMPLFMELRGTDNKTMEHVKTAYTQTINPASKVYFNTWAKAMAVSQQLGSVHVFHSPQWLIGPPVFNVADMVNSLITTTLVGLTTVPLARAVKHKKDETLDVNYERFAQSHTNDRYYLRTKKAQLGSKAPTRPTEDRVFKTVSNWATLNFHTAKSNKLMNIKTFDRRTPQRFETIPFQMKGSEETIDLQKPKGLSYKTGITTVKHSQFMQDMKQATLPLGREALTATAKLLKSPYTGLKAGYNDIWGQNSMRAYNLAKQEAELATYRTLFDNL